MTSSKSSQLSSESLLGGPRGRRLLLEYALSSELIQNPVRDEESFGWAALLAASQLHAKWESGSALIGDVLALEKEILSGVTPARAAERLNSVELLDPTPGVVRAALAAAVDHGRYWPEPDGEDLLTATTEMDSALRRVADHIVAGGCTASWTTPAATHKQQAVQWDGEAPRPALDNAQETLRVVRDQERGARAHHRINQAAGWGEEWRSSPPQISPKSTRSLFDGSPGGLWFTEDSIGRERAESVSLIVPDGLRIFEIESAAEWKQLCAWFPLAVAAPYRSDRRRAATRTDNWVVPDWSRVAERFDAVHLQIGAYLTVADVVITVDSRSGTESVITGWNPDETYWFTPAIEYDSDYTCWRLEDHGSALDWLPDRV